MNGKALWNTISIIGILAILVGILLIYEETHKAKEFCESIDGKYVLKAYPPPVVYQCNNQTIVQYADGWDFERNITQIEQNFTIDPSVIPNSN